jgi:hypothetical protein
MSIGICVGVIAIGLGSEGEFKLLCSTTMGDGGTLSG